MKKKGNENVIVIGGDHYNALGVIRSLGRKKIHPIFILVSEEKYNFSSKSKYIKKTYQFSPSNMNSILEFLMNNNEFYENTLIIPTGDPIECFIDKNYDKLSKKYILPNINKKAGEVTKYMDKSIQEKLCAQNGILYPKSFYIDLTKYNYSDYDFPNMIIIKPVVSAHGKKADIIISEGKNKHEEAIRKFVELGYKEIFVQEFIKYDMEYALMGFANGKNVVIPGINSNNFIYPSNRGNTSFAKMFPVKDFEYDISKIITMISKLNYQGLFEVEVFVANGNLILNEINFRNSANCYGYLGNKVNYIYLYVLSRYNKEWKKEKYSVDKPFNFCIDHLHFKNIKEGKISFIRFLCNYFNSTKLIYNFWDMKPFLSRVYYALKRRLKK